MRAGLEAPDSYSSFPPALFEVLDFVDTEGMKGLSLTKIKPWTIPSAAGVHPQHACDDINITGAVDTPKGQDPSRGTWSSWRSGAM